MLLTYKDIHANCTKVQFRSADFCGKITGNLIGFRMNHYAKSQEGTGQP